MNSDKLKGLIKEKALTQKELAKMLDMSTQSLNAKINKKKQFTLNEVINMIEKLNIEEPEKIFLSK